jgi:malate synthase
MEDAATAEIARSQVWQWIRHGARLDDGRTVTRELVETVLEEEMARIRADVGEDVWHKGRPDETRDVFTRIALRDDLPEFLTIDAYDRL